MEWPQLHTQQWYRKLKSKRTRTIPSQLRHLTREQEIAIKNLNHKLCLLFVYINPAKFYMAYVLLPLQGGKRIWVGLVSLFNGISTFVGYLMPKPFS